MYPESHGHLGKAHSSLEFHGVPAEGCSDDLVDYNLGEASVAEV